MKRRSLLCALLALLVLSAVPAANAANAQTRTERVPLRDSAPYESSSYARFLDVPATHWGKDGISYVVDQGLFNGTAPDRFSPDDTMNLAMLCTVLYRFGGSPSVDEGSLHSDFAARSADIYNNAYAAIPKGLWYSDAMVWALKNEILNEPRYTVSGAMDPAAAITRGEFSVMLRNFYAYSGGGRANDYIPSLENTFKDLLSTGMDTRYASMSWAYTYGILNGTGAATMSPDGLMTRAQAAAMLERYARQFGTGKPIDPPAQVSEEYQLTIAGTAYALGMTAEELTGLAGQPDAAVPSSTGGNWYVFGTKTYLDFFMADVLDGKVVRLASGGKAFSYQGYVAGAEGATASGEIARLYTDSNDGGTLHAVMLRESAVQETAFDVEALYGESVANFHMVNAFRVYHGLNAFQWNESAATAARLHSEDMAGQDYFSHDSLDGRSAWDRMGAQGLNFRSAAENISAGRRNGVEAYNSWVNSSGHRSNMLGPCTRLGVGAGYNASSTYRWYMTQDFYTPF